MSTRQPIDDNNIGDAMRKDRFDCPEYFDLKPNGDDVLVRQQIKSDDVVNMIDYIQANLERK